MLLLIYEGKVWNLSVDMLIGNKVSREHKFYGPMRTLVSMLRVNISFKSYIGFLVTMLRSST